jgi:hypothetical protein
MLAESLQRLQAALPLLTPPALGRNAIELRLDATESLD